MISLERLRKFAFLKKFNDGQLNKLALIAVEETYSAGTQMYQQGDPARSLFLIEEGKIVLFMERQTGRQKSPMQVTVDMITAGEAMGWSAVVEPYVYTLSALCIDDAAVIALDAFALRRLMEEDCTLGFDLMQAVAKTIACRLTHTRIILVGEKLVSLNGIEAADNS